MSSDAGELKGPAASRTATAAAAAGGGQPDLKYQAVQRALVRLNPCVLKTLALSTFVAQLHG